jgi:hypothetical protein
LDTKTDESLHSFLLSLKNPTNAPAVKFPLKPEQMKDATYCTEGYGPAFGCGKSGSDLYLSGTSAFVMNKSGGLGRSYANETKMDGKRLLTGREYFNVKEIEVFEIIG